MQEPYYNPKKHGFGSRVVQMLAAVPYALRHGYDIQLSSQTCAIEDADRPHCFFQPLTTGCPRRSIIHTCSEWGTICWMDGNVTHTHRTEGTVDLSLLKLWPDPFR